MFDREAKRRKSQHLRAITGLKGELSKLKQVCGEVLSENNGQIEEGSPIEKLMSKIGQISSQIDVQIERVAKRDEDDRESSGFGEVGDQQILIGRGQGEDSHIIDSVRDSLNINNENGISIAVQNMLTQANFDVKPFLDYILQNNDFDKEELLELKRKVALLKSKQAKKNLSILSGRKEDVEKIM